MKIDAVVVKWADGARTLMQAPYGLVARAGCAVTDGKNIGTVLSVHSVDDASEVREIVRVQESPSVYSQAQRVKSVAHWRECVYQEDEHGTD